MLRVRIQAIETLTSFVSRSARANGVERMRSFCADIGVSPSKVKSGDPAEISRLAEVLDVSKARLAAAAVQRGKGTLVRIGNEWFDNGRLNRQHRRFCPECVKADMAVPTALPPGPWYRSYWLLPQIEACVEHETRIMEIEQPQKLESNSQDFSAIIDLSLKRLPSLLETTEHLQPNSYERYLASRVTGTAVDNAFLAELPVETIIVLSEAIGASFSSGSSGVSPSEAVRREPSAHGFACLEVGQAGFQKALDAISSSAPAGSFSPHGTYRRLYTALAYHEGASYDLFRRLLTEHANSTGRVAPGTNLFRGRSAPAAIRVSAVAEEAGAAVARVKRVLKLTGGSDAGGGAGLIDPVAADRAVKHFQDAWSLMKAREHLGCSLRVLRTLLDTASIPLPVPAMPQGFTSRANITEFADRIAAHASGQPSTTMEDLTTAADRADSSVPEIIAYILDGKLRSVALAADVPVLLGLRVDVEEVRRAHLPNGHVTAEEARSRLRLNATGFAGLVKAGHLKTVQLAFPRQKWWAVDSAEIDRFNSRYVTLQECAEKMDVTKNAMVSLARQWKLHPAYPYEVIGQKIFWRSAVADFIPDLAVFPECSAPK
jgi:hypothetical protein